MAGSTPYRWQGNLYCDTEVVDLLTEIEPWADWLKAGHRASDDAEADLNSLAEFFDIDRTDFDQCLRRGFPIKTAGASGMCSYCLHWFN